uniref:helix-turn-helix transcriptional regulator n=1 Tax=Xylanibacter caecicola TaxID=2736294 RepID=UPI00259C9F2F
MKDRIKKIRKELDLTQQKFSDKLGVKRNTIAMYEMGKTFPSDQTLKSIVREFNVNEEWLRSGTGEMFKAPPNEALDALASEYDLSHGDYVLIEKFVNLKAEKRAAVVDYVLQAAAAMQGEGADPAVPVIIPEPQTVTKEE